MTTEPRDASAVSALAAAIADSVNLIAALASPKVAHKWVAQGGLGSLHEASIAALDTWFTTARALGGPASPDTEGSQFPYPLLTRLRSELAAAHDERIPGEAIVALSREVLAALGVPEPDGGWDAFDIAVSS